jgi:hypothetical protein
MSFATPDVFSGTNEDSGIMSIALFPTPVAFQQIIAPTLCQIQDA